MARFWQNTPVRMAISSESGVSTVLVADSDDEFLEQMVTWLDRLGYRARVSATAEQALEAVRRERPDVVLVDLVLPGSEGPQMIARLRDSRPRMPVVAITSDADRDLVVKAFHQGAIGVLQKPLDMISLEAALRRCLQCVGLFADGTGGPELSAVMQVHHAIASGTAASGLLDLLLQEMIRYTHADAASILLVEPDGQTMRIKASFGLDEQVVDDARVIVGERISGWVVAHDEPRVVIGEATGEDCRPLRSERIRPASMGLCLPMRGRDRVVGALCVTRFEGDEIFSRDAIELGLLLGGEVARALERAGAAEKKLDLERSVMRRDKLATIGELASGVAHEINNPLGFVSSNMSSLDRYLAEILPVLSSVAKARGTGDLRAVLEAAEPVDLGFILSDLPVCMRETQEGLERVLKIVADLRDFARDDTDVREMGSLNEILDGAVSILWSQIKYKAELVKEYADLPGFVCYPSRLGQVFLNLLHNAAQSIDRRGRIVVRTRSENGSVVAEVEDNGCGMKPEAMERMFEPFYTTKPRGVGTGLGLSIARKIVEKHGGSVEVDSQEGRGTRFRIIFPLTEKSSATATVQN